MSASEMTYIVSSWALNSTHSLTHLHKSCICMCKLSRHVLGHGRGVTLLRYNSPPSRAFL